MKKLFHYSLILVAAMLSFVDAQQSWIDVQQFVEVDGFAQHPQNSDISFAIS
jgi:hypothetical protein